MRTLQILNCDGFHLDFTDLESLLELSIQNCSEISVLKISAHLEKLHVENCQVTAIADIQNLV